MISIPFCGKCGNKLKPDSKFCSKCGAALSGGEEASGKGKEAEGKAAGGKDAGVSVKATPTQPNSAWTILGILFGVLLACIILLGIIGSTESMLSLGSNYGGNNGGVTKTCADKAGSVTCGYCSASAGGSHAGQCRYCPNGYVCSGEICSEELKCKPASKTSPQPSTQPSTQPSGVPTPSPTRGGGGDGGGGGGGVLTNFDFDGRTGCPVQGSTSSWGASNLQCSQWIEATRCSIQSCTCYYPQANGQVIRAYYHTSDEAYFPCSGSGSSISCTNSAVAAAQHCGPTPAPNIVWG